jgi:hypothetical protein
MKSYVTLICLLFSVALLSAQDWSSDVYKMGELYPGYIIEENGAQTEGFIKYQNRYKMQNEVLFFKDKDAKKAKYKTADLKEYKVADKLYHCIHYSGGLMSKPVRANLLVSEGCITEYVWYDRADDFMAMRQSYGETEEEFMARMYPPKIVYQKQGTEEPKTVDYFLLKFSKKMSEFVSENKELSAKVLAKDKGYGMLKVQAIIAEYNEACTQ